MFTLCHALRWRFFISSIKPAKNGTPARMTRAIFQCIANMNTAMNIRLKISRTKVMIPFERVSDTLLT